MSHYFVITGIKNGVPVYKTRMRTRPSSWSADPMDAKKYLSRKTAEGAMNSKGVIMYAVGIKNISVDEILPNDSRYIPPKCLSR